LPACPVGLQVGISISCHLQLVQICRLLVSYASCACFKWTAESMIVRRTGNAVLRCCSMVLSTCHAAASLSVKSKGHKRRRWWTAEHACSACVGPCKFFALYLLTASAIWLQARALRARQQQPPREARTAERYELWALFLV